MILSSSHILFVSGSVKSWWDPFYSSHIKLHHFTVLYNTRRCVDFNLKSIHYFEWRNFTLNLNCIMSKFYFQRWTSESWMMLRRNYIIFCYKWIFRHWRNYIILGKNRRKLCENDKNRNPEIYQSIKGRTRR